MDGTPLLLAIIGHFVGDYLLQNDWMATQKKVEGKDGRSACLFHCFFWTLSVCLFADWGIVPFIILYAFHFAQDRTHVVAWWMRFNGQAGFMEPPFAPWSLIVVDNVWHIVQIWFVWRFIA